MRLSELKKIVTRLDDEMQQLKGVVDPIVVIKGECDDRGFVLGIESVEGQVLFREHTTVRVLVATCELSPQERLLA